MIREGRGSRKMRSSMRIIRRIMRCRMGMAGLGKGLCMGRGGISRI